jgi:hypothetical protein
VASHDHDRGRDAWTAKQLFNAACDEAVYGPLRDVPVQKVLNRLGIERCCKVAPDRSGG